jgi:alpha-L-fucosidase
MDTVINDHPHVGKSKYSAPDKAVENWRDKKMGLFIHWDAASQLGNAETSWARKKVGAEVYDRQYKTFNPKQYDPEQWVQTAWAGGARYIVITAKHHAGFCNFDSKATDYDIMSTPYKKDTLKMLEQACRKKNMEFGFYYSPRDWFHPACGKENHDPVYNDFYKKQMTELLENYGSIFSVWFDGLGPGTWKKVPEEVAAMMRKRHPDVMVNDRGGYKGDFYTTEHSIGPYNINTPWETCQTTSYGTWGYIERSKSKPTSMLIEMGVYTWARGGNYLLNIGPGGDGKFHKNDYASWKELADWMSVYEETVHGTRAGPFTDGAWGASTAKRETAYVYIYDWDKNGVRVLPDIPGKKLLQVRNLSGEKTEYIKIKKGISIKKPFSFRESMPSVFALIYDGEVQELPPISVQDTAIIKKAVCNEKDPALLIDGNVHTMWEARGNSDNQVIVDIHFKKKYTMHAFMASRGIQKWDPKLRFTISVPAGSDWEVLPATGLPNYTHKKHWTQRFQPVKRFHEPVTVNKLRLTFEVRPQGRKPGKVILNDIVFFESGK